MHDLTFEIKDNPNLDEQSIIRDGIVGFNQSIINDKPSCFNIFVKVNDKVIGGSIVYQHIDALYIDVIWCMEEYRRNGIGSKLMYMIEAQAKKSSIQKIFVDTYAFQAEDFYKKHNFNVIGCAPEYLLGHDRIFLRKDLG